MSSLQDVSAEIWNALVGNNYPFLYHQFLLALEQTRCVGESTGWIPNYLVLENNNGELLAAAPLYIKYDSLGEFVFDWAWADAYEKSGLAYYPKLVIAPPFTPATGPRLLVAPHADQALKQQLLDQLILYAHRSGFSSLHILYPTDLFAYQQSSQLIKRFGYEFHWKNRNYDSFEAFLNTFKSKRRKQIKKERRTIQDADISIEQIAGNDISEHQLHTFYNLYLHTFQRYGNYPALTLEFFQQITETMGQAILLVLASDHKRIIAASFFLRGSDSLYGRYWGAFEDIPCLHFELCYYQGHEYCIEHQIQHFEPGAQGEHKISRGFVPTETSSYHWIAHQGFKHAIRRHVQKEGQHLKAYMSELAAHSPYRRTEQTNPSASAK
ncbi:MAG TPA: N-acetyltransferase [Crenotrichaceae bacterium]|nr:N-acetyltransferase [Crenotrichaceae bacterium]